MFRNYMMGYRQRLHAFRFCRVGIILTWGIIYHVVGLLCVYARFRAKRIPRTVDRYSE